MLIFYNCKHYPYVNQTVFFIVYLKLARNKNVYIDMWTVCTLLSCFFVLFFGYYSSKAIK